MLITFPESVTARVDKYGRKLSKTKDQDDLRRFYRLNDDDGSDAEPSAGPSAPDYARGEGLLESSDEDDGESASDASEESEADEAEEDDEPITFARHSGSSKLKSKSKLLDEDDALPEIDLDETNFEDLDAQAAAYSREHGEADPEASSSTGKATSRIAVVNLDWDHVKAPHLYKVFSSVVPPASGRARVVGVRVYPSQFGKERMAKEELEGPPVELFASERRKEELEDEDEEDVNEETIFETGDAESAVNNDALRKYQLDRLR